MTTAIAILKKLAVAVATDSKARKIVGGIILGIILIAIMPFLVIQGLQDGTIQFDTERLVEIIDENMTAEEKERLQRINDIMFEIEEQMLEAGYHAERVQEAQILFVLVLEEQSLQDGFVERLISCFAPEQTDEELIQQVNQVFGLSLDAGEFTQIMNGIRSVAIDSSDYTDPTTKNNLDLVKYAKHAKEAGWGYVWGTYGQILTKNSFKSLLEQYPDEVGGYKSFIEQNWLGKRTADCGGLIKGYVWLNVETKQIEVGANGLPALRADEIYAQATEKGAIGSMPEIVGLAVWKPGHIGVYIGEGKVIEAMGTISGVVETNLEGSSWTHWLKVPSITYVETEREE